MKSEFSLELIQKAKSAKSTAELIAVAKENGMELTEVEAAAYFAKLTPKSGVISDDELTNVAGGGCWEAADRLPDDGTTGYKRIYNAVEEICDKFENRVYPGETNGCCYLCSYFRGLPSYEFRGTCINYANYK